MTIYLNIKYTKISKFITSYLELPKEQYVIYVYSIPPEHMWFRANYYRRFSFVFWFLFRMWCVNKMKNWVKWLFPWSMRSCLSRRRARSSLRIVKSSVSAEDCDSAEAVFLDFPFKIKDRQQIVAWMFQLVFRARRVLFSVFPQHKTKVFVTAHTQYIHTYIYIRLYMLSAYI